MSRKIGNFEKFYLLSDSFNQLVFKFDKKELRDRIIELLNQRVIGLHLNFNPIQKSLCINDKPLKYLKIPNNVTDMRYASEFMEKNSYSSSRRIATIGYNDNFVGLNVNHLAGDGTFLKNLVEEISSNRDIEKVRGFPDLPEVVFRKEIDSHNEVVRLAHNDINIPRVYTDTPHSKNSVSRTTEFCEPMKNLSNYNHKTKRLEKLTEHLWIHSSIANAIISRKFDRLGGSTCFDLRRLYKTKPTWNVCDHIVDISVYTDFTFGDRIKDLKKLLREDFNKKLNSGFPYKYLYTQEKMIRGEIPLFNEGEDLKGAALEISSIGKLTPHGIISDCRISTSSRRWAAEDVCNILCYSVESNTRNDFILQLESSPFFLTESEANLMSKALRISLTKCSDELTIGDAFNLVKSELML